MTSGTWVAWGRVAHSLAGRCRRRNLLAQPAPDRKDGGLLAVQAIFPQDTNLQSERERVCEGLLTHPRSVRAPPSPSWSQAGPFVTFRRHFNTKPAPSAPQQIEG